MLLHFDALGCCHYTHVNLDLRSVLAAPAKDLLSSKLERMLAKAILVELAISRAEAILVPATVVGLNRPGNLDSGILLPLHADIILRKDLAPEISELGVFC